MGNGSGRAPGNTTGSAHTARSHVGSCWSCAADDLQTLGCVDDLAVYRGGRADDERVGVADRLEEIGAAGPGDAADFYRLAQGLFGFRREWVRNEHDWCVREHWFSLGDLKGKRPLILSALVCVFRLTDALLELL